MELTFDLADEIDPVAIYAAIVATFVLVWDAIKWWSRGPRLQGWARPNMIFAGGRGFERDTKYVIFDVANTGSTPTTITTIGLLGYDGWWSWLLNKSTKAAVVMHPGDVYPLPYVLKVGEKFMSQCQQTQDLIEWSHTERVYGVIYHTFGRPLYLRIPPIEMSDVEGVTSEDSPST